MTKEQTGAWWAVWRARLGFGALLLVASELVVWQTPTEHGALRWLALAAIYVALAAVALDLVARLRVHEVFSLLLLAGLYGLVNGTLVSHITGRDLPLSLVVRPLAAQPLAFLLALAAFQVLQSGRATGPLDSGMALVVGLAWGVWVRWFPVISDDPIPAVTLSEALPVLVVALAGLLVAHYGLFFAGGPPHITQRAGWLLTPLEWIAAGLVVLIALGAGLAGDDISGAALAVTAMLGSYLVMTLVITRATRRDDSLLATVTPPRPPNPVSWLALAVPLVVAGWIGYRLPGSGDSSAQSDLLIAALTAFGVAWLPAVSIVTGVRSFIELSREGL